MVGRMASVKERIPFEMTGVFCGVVEWRDGLPRRIEVESEDGVSVLKVGKELRGAFLGMEPGVELSLRGVEKLTGRRLKRKITWLGGDWAEGRKRLTIQVCGKRNCWERGGREIYRQLEARIAEGGLEHVKLRKSGCLGNCKECPSARLPGHDLVVGRANAEKLEGYLPV